MFNKRGKGLGWVSESLRAIVVSHHEAVDTLKRIGFVAANARRRTVPL